MSAVVVDTSVWIAFFAGRATERLDDALRAGAVVVPPIVVAELLSVARTGDRRQLVEFLADVEIGHTPFSHWVAVGDLRASLRRRGLTVSTPDAHVAQTALDHGAVLLTHDAVFTRIAEATALRVARG